MNKIVLLGPPGCGKGTQSKLLVEKQKFYQLSTGDLLREQTGNSNSEYGQKIKDIMKKGDLVPDEIVINLIVEKILIYKNESVIFDGFPRNLNQAEVLDDSLEKNSINLNFAILLDVDFDILKERILKRIKDSPEEARSDDNLETLNKRIDVYKSDTFPIVDYYENKGILKRLNGMDSIENINKEILKIIN